MLSSSLNIFISYVSFCLLYHDYEKKISYYLYKNAKLSFQSTFVPFGGRLKEKICIADYGDIGGVQRVNCRLEATELEPKETLKYLFNERKKDDNRFL